MPYPFVLHSRGTVFFKERGRRKYNAQWRLELVGGEADEFGFHFVQSLFLRQGQLHFLAGFHLGSNIPGDLDKAGQTTLLIPKDRKDDIGPEYRSVLPLPTSDTFIPAVFHRLPEIGGRVATLALFFRIKD